MIVKLRDPVSGLTHLGGMLLSIPGMIMLIIGGVRAESTAQVVAFSIYGASLILLYCASSLYHLLPLSERGVAIMRRIDHIMIYILIAGTYTPVCLLILSGAVGYGLLAGIWAAALIGLFLKIFWFDAPRWLSTLFYVIMGVVIAAFLPLLWDLMEPGAVAWLVAGGVVYILGAIIYATRLPILNFVQAFGFHEVFHIFVLGGSFCHYWMMYHYLMG